MSTATKNALENFEAINYDPAVHKWSDVSTLKLPFESIRYDFDSHKLEVLDQLLLPSQTVYIPVRNVEETFAVIRAMNVRGAPLIASVALLGLCVDVQHAPSAAAAPDLAAYIRASCARLLESRPTAINMRNEFARLSAQFDGWQHDDRDALKKKLFMYVESFYCSERRENDALLRHATICVEHNAPADGKLRVATICNTGALATCSFGTALGVVCALHWRDRLEECVALETRPYLQGARLTAYELLR